MKTLWLKNTKSIISYTSNVNKNWIQNTVTLVARWYFFSPSTVDSNFQRSSHKKWKSLRFIGCCTCIFCVRYRVTIEARTSGKKSIENGQRAEFQLTP